MAAYYNEIEPYAAQWLRNLIDAGHIAPGDVDERSIEDVQPDDLLGYTQCHFFAGIGVWSYALRQAGWEDVRPIWTGSCPCQPFSNAGRGGGFDDKRHLWPVWNKLIQEHRPPVIAGEQVSSKSAEPWIDLVQADLEEMDYAFGCIPFPSAGVGAPHIRDRNYWMAHTESKRHEWSRHTWQRGNGPSDGSSIFRMAHALSEGWRQIGCDAESHRETRERWPRNRNGDGSSYGKPIGLDKSSPTGPTNGYWRDADWLYCRDGKWRPVEPCTFPLAHGIANRVGRLRAYGNAINAKAAQAFIEVMLECIP